MRNLSIITNVILILIFASCQTKEKKESGEIISIQIPESTMGFWNIFDFFTDVKVIPLETNDRSLLGRIKKVVVTDEKIIILDDQRKRLQIFDNTGAHIESIDQIGLGPGELMSPLDFNVIDNVVWIYDSQNGLVKYSIEGDFISQNKDLFKSIPTKSFFDILSFENIGDSLFLFRREIPGNGVDFEYGKKLYMGTFDRLRDSFLTYSKDNFSNHNTTFTNYFSDFKHGYNYWEIFVDTLYYVDASASKLFHKYFFDFGKRSLADKISQMDLSLLLNHLNKYGSVYSGMVRNFVEFDDFLFFNYTKDLSNKNSIPQYAVLDKKNNMITTYDGLYIDSLDLEFLELQFKLSDNSSLAFIESLDLFENHNNTGYIDNHLKSRTSSDNPILIVMSK